jgi:ribosomal protein S8
MGSTLLTDMLCKIKNSQQLKKKMVLVPFSKKNLVVLRILYNEGFIRGFSFVYFGFFHRNVLLKNKCSFFKKFNIDPFRNNSYIQCKKDFLFILYRSAFHGVKYRVLIFLKYKDSVGLINNFSIFNGQTFFFSGKDCALSIYELSLKQNLLCSGFGVSILSTSLGVLSHKVAGQLLVGGRLLCHIY